MLPFAFWHQTYCEDLLILAIFWWDYLIVTCQWLPPKVLATKFFEDGHWSGPFANDQIFLRRCDNVTRRSDQVILKLRRFQGHNPNSCYILLIFFCGNSQLLCVSIWHEILKTRLLTRIPTLWLSTIRIVTRLWWSEKSSHCNNQNCNCQNCDKQNCDGTFNNLPWASPRGVARSYQTINKSSPTLRNTPSTPSYNPTLLQGALIADITRFSGRCCALAITPWFYTTSFSSGWLLGACECCWLCRQCAIASVPSAKCQVLVGKMHQMQLVLASPAPTQPP